MTKPKIIILAQTPPPFYGQSIMQEYLVNAKWEWCEKKHIPLLFSDDIGQVGKFIVSKIFRLVKVISKVWLERIKGKIDVLYYPPAGPHRIPFYRDVLILSMIRLCAKKVIFHFHAGNFDGLMNILTKWELKLARLVYQSPDAAIVLLQSLENEIRWISPKNTFIIPNGISDVYEKYKIIKKENEVDICKILFVGLLSSKKGLFVCLEAISILQSRKLDFIFVFMGGWQSSEVKNKAENYINENSLSQFVEFLGIRSGNQKWEQISKADIFVMPTFETEAMPITIVEAMMMCLPVVSTKWRAIDNILDDDINGYLVPAKDPIALANKIELLIKNKHLRSMIGNKARQKYLNEYTLEKHLTNIEEVFKKITNQ